MAQFLRSRIGGVGKAGSVKDEVFHRAAILRNFQHICRQTGQGQHIRIWAYTQRKRLADEAAQSERQYGTRALHALLPRQDLIPAAAGEAHKTALASGQDRRVRVDLKERQALVIAEISQAHAGDIALVVFTFHAADRIMPLEPCKFEEAAAGKLRFQLLGLDLTDGLSVWLRVQNDSGEELPFGEKRMEGMLNSSVVSFVNSGSRIPAGADCLVLLRAAEFDDDGTADSFAYHLPALSELNTLKLRLGSGEDANNVTVMFQDNGNIMLANASMVNAAIPEELKG